ncbi:MAG: DNA polymerase I, partial [Bifidobacteriaceae bacterium]|nr:DNA polymerase I [Bifidobacteriaceae bacterium]
MNKYLYIDGHSLLFRAFYAYNVENFSGEDDFPTNAIYGFISMLKNVCREFNPTHLAVTFDTKEKTFRNKLLPIYKGNRESPPEGFLPQLDYLQTLLQIAGIKVLTYPGYEADDILATLSTNTAKLDDSEVFIFSGDRDTFQLIKPNVSILYPGRSMRDLKKFNDDEVFEKYGLHALQYPDLAALVGETSDNIPGIPGVGPKTATKWLTQYGNLQNVIDHADEVGGKIGETLRANTDVALLNRKINNLVCDLELDADFDSFDIDLSAKRADFDEMKVAFKKLHFSKNSQKLLLDILHLNSLDSNDNFTLDAKADSDKNAMADS